MSHERRRPDTAHIPLPYVVQLRGQLDDDSPPFTRVYRGQAYSLFEAVLQAIFEAGGAGLEDIRFNVESVGPDMNEYMRIFESVEGFLKAISPKEKS